MRRFKPLVDAVYLVMCVPILLLPIALAVLPVLSPFGRITCALFAIFVFYFVVSPFFGYVELRESTVYIKYGIILKKEIPYGAIRGVERKKRFHSDAMLSLKCSLEHVDIKYNTFALTVVSVVDNDTFIAALEERIRASGECAEGDEK